MKFTEKPRGGGKSDNMMISPGLNHRSEKVITTNLKEKIYHISYSGDILANIRGDNDYVEGTNENSSVISSPASEGTAGKNRKVKLV